MSSFYIGAFYFFYFAGMGLWVIFAPKTLQQLGYNEFQIGIVFAITPFIRFLSPFFFLRIGAITKRMFLYSSALAFISSVFFIFSVEHFYFFIVNILIFSIFWVLILPFADSVALDNIPSTKYGFVRLFGSIGFMLIGIVLGEKANWSFIVYALYVLFMFITLIFCFQLAKLDTEKTTQNEPIQTNSFNPIPQWQMWLSMFLLQFSFGAFYNFFTIYETSHGISLSTTTYLWAFGVLCEIIMFIFQGKFIDKINPVVVIKYTTLATVARWLILYLFPTSIVASFISQSFHALNFALYTTAVFLFLSSTYKESKRVAQLFFYGISYGLGGYLGAIFSGYFYSEQIFLYSAISALLGFIIFYLPSRQGLANT